MNVRAQLRQSKSGRGDDPSSWLRSKTTECRFPRRLRHLAAFEFVYTSEDRYALQQKSVEKVKTP